MVHVIVILLPLEICFFLLLFEETNGRVQFIVQLIPQHILMHECIVMSHVRVHTDKDTHTHTHLTRPHASSHCSSLHRLHCLAALPYLSRRTYI